MLLLAKPRARHRARVRTVRLLVCALSMIGVLALGCSDDASSGAGGRGTGGTAGSGGDGGTAVVDPSSPGVFRVVLMADTHIIGPQYVCCSESPGVDNTSIVKTEDRLRSVVQQLNSVEPRPELAFVLGDLVHDAHHEHEAQWYQENRNAFTVARELFDDLDIPLHVLWGNHDYEVNCGGDSFDKSLTHQLFLDFFDTEPFYALNYRGWKFLFMNSQLGPSWDPTHERCKTANGSFGEDQMRWVSEQLDEGSPTVVMSHHMSALWMSNEFPNTENADMETVLGRYENDVIRFMGHTHRWLQFPSKNEFPIAATRYDDDNFWIVEFDGTDGSYTILDTDKAIDRSTCGLTYTYAGTPMLVEDAPEMGDCMVGF